MVYDCFASVFCYLKITWVIPQQEEERGKEEVVEIWTSMLARKIQDVSLDYVSNDAKNSLLFVEAFEQ